MSLLAEAGTTKIQLIIQTIERTIRILFTYPLSVSSTALITVNDQFLVGSGCIHDLEILVYCKVLVAQKQDSD